MSDELDQPMPHPSTNIYTALFEAQGRFPVLIKDSVNPHFKSRYMGLPAILAAVVPVLREHGILHYWTQVPADSGETRFERTNLMHLPSGTSMHTDIPLVLGKHDMQGVGSAITYARRYGLLDLIGLAPDDDDDGNAAAASTTNGGTQSPPLDW